MCQVCYPGLVRLCCNHRPAQVSEFVHNTGLVLSLEKPSQGALPCGGDCVSEAALSNCPSRTNCAPTIATAQKEHWESLLGDAVTWKGKGPLLPTAHVQEHLEVFAQWS